MTAAIMAGLMSADVLKASYASLDDVPIADIWKNYLAQAGELSRAASSRIDEVKLHARERADGFLPPSSSTTPSSARGRQRGRPPRDWRHTPAPAAASSSR